MKLILQCSGNCKWILNKFLFALPASNFGLINYKCTHTHAHIQIHSHLKFCILQFGAFNCIQFSRHFDKKNIIKGTQNQATNWFQLRYPRNNNTNYNNSSINKEQAKKHRNSLTFPDKWERERMLRANGVTCKQACLARLPERRHTAFSSSLLLIYGCR